MTPRIGDKIRRLRELLNESQAEFGDRFDVEQATVSRWEKGAAVKRDLQEPVARLAGMSVAEFFHSSEGPRLVPIVGYVSGGERFEPSDDFQAGSDVVHIPLTIGGEDQIAVRVRGESMSPVYRDGDTIIGSRLGRRDAAKFANRDCIIKTASGDGYVKRVLPGSRRGLYRLRSYNPAYDDIIDVEVEWAAPIVWIGRA